MNDFNTLLDKLLSMFPLKVLIGIFLVVIMDVWKDRGRQSQAFGSLSRPFLQPDAPVLSGAK